MNKKVMYRLEVDYLSREYDDSALETSSPIYALDEGIARYEEATQEKCVDDPSKAARVHLWKYAYKGNRLAPITIRKNY